MTLTEKILLQVQGLPELLQAEVLDFVERLEAKVKNNKKGHEELEWTTISLSLAMSGMEDESSLYAINDLNEDICVEGLLAGRPSGECQASFKKWLKQRNQRQSKRLRGTNG